MASLDMTPGTAPLPDRRSSFEIPSIGANKSRAARGCAGRVLLHVMPLGALLHRLEAFAEPELRDMAHRPWTEEEHATLRLLWPDRAVPVREIARRLKRKFYPVCVRAHVLGLKPRRQVLHEQDALMIQRLHHTDHLSKTEIARRYGIAEATVHAFMKLHGIETRQQAAPCRRRSHPLRTYRPAAGAVA